MTSKEEVEFWWEAERRRNLFFYASLAWLFAGLPLIAFFGWSLFPQNPLAAGTAALITWGIPWYAAAIHLSRLRCFKCRGTAFPHPFFFMKHARCSQCGISRSGR